jgi:hypothetical protein
MARQRRNNAERRRECRRHAGRHLGPVRTLQSWTLELSLTWLVHRTLGMFAVGLRTFGDA